VNKKIPPDAFTYYASLGPARSYEAVAKKFGVTKRGIFEHARRERWPDRIAEVERRAREEADAKAQESLEEMNDRHLREARLLQAKAIEGLKSGRIEALAPCTKAMHTGVQMERLVRGQATERSETTVEQIIKRQYERWMAASDEEVEDDELEGDAGGDDHDAP
jgi:hypothetical protein